MSKYLKITAFVVVWMGIGVIAFFGVGSCNHLLTLSDEYNTNLFIDNLCDYIQENRSWPGPDDSFTSKHRLEIHHFNHDIDIHEDSFADILMAVKTKKKYFTVYPHQRRHLGRLVDVVIEARSKNPTKLKERVGPIMIGQ